MRVHIVQKGDTLWKIAKQYAIGFDELKRLNAHLANPDYIVPGMEIYLPALQKEKETMKEKPVEHVTQAPVEHMKEHMWQGDVYFQPQMPMSMPMPQWQHTHVHVEPTTNQTMMMPMQAPMPSMPHMMPMQMPMQPLYIQQPCPPQMMPYPMPICICCHGVRMEEQMMTAPMQREESSAMPKKCAEQDARVQQYYEEMQQIAQQPSCHQPAHQPCVMPMHPMRQWHM